MPQGREIFARMGLAYKSASTPVPAELYELFPELKQMLGRRGGDLSGGQPVKLYVQTKTRVKGLRVPALALMKNPANQTVVWVKPPAHRGPGL